MQRIKPNALPASADASAADDSLADAVAANRLAILQSPSYELAEVDIDFLKRKENRPLRMQLELLKTETLLREHEIDATVVVFGGTQIMRREKAEAVLREARLNAQKKPNDSKVLRACAVPNGFMPKATSTTKPANSAASSPPPHSPKAAPSYSS